MFADASKWPWVPRHETSLLLAIVIVLALTTWLDANHNYWKQPRESAQNLARTSTRLGLIALGAAVVIIAGGIDLSTGSVMAFSGTVCAAVMLCLEPEAMLRNQPLGIATMTWGIAAALCSGFLVGSLHAWLIAAVGLPPFVATLGTLVGLRSLARAICGAVMANFVGGKTNTQINVPDLRFRYLTNSFWIPVVLLLVTSAVLWLLLSKTVTGRHLYALGGNEQAARISGVETDRLKWLAYVISAMLSSLAGVLVVCEVSAAQPETLARGYELNAIAAAVVGGCSLQGGVGSVPGTLLGAVFLRAVVDGVANVIKTDADVYEGLIVGVLVVCAVMLTKSSELAVPRRLLRGALGWVTIVNLTLLCAAMMALIGVRLIGDKTYLETWQLTAWSAACGFAGLLIVRQNLPVSTRKWWIAGWGLLTILSLIGLDFGYKTSQRNAAVRMARELGGQVTQNNQEIIVSFRDTPLTDEQWRGFVPKLSFFPDLVEIRLQNTQITNRSLDALGQLRRKPENLQRIELAGTNTTPAGFRQLREYKKLKTVP
jgi:ribose/xylose/arabinose/galactoside ABC-type transport system permease subunit